MEPPPFVLSPEESRVLEEEQIFLSRPVNGKCKVSAALLSPPSSQASRSSLSSQSSASVHIRASDPSTAVPFDLPEDLESVAALEFLGYTRKIAGEIFERWAGRPDPEQNPDGLREYALSNLGRLHLQPLMDLPALLAMENLGISNELQMSLTDPRFSQLFQSEALHHWLKDTMRLRYSTLDKVLERLKSHAIHTIAKRKEKKRPKIAGVFESDGSSSISQPISSAILPSATASSSIASEESALPRACVAVQVAPPALPDHYIFYKGKAVGDMKEEMFVWVDGSINMDSIRTERGGDFNHKQAAWYWTKEEATAELYRKWSENRCRGAETWIIQIQVPKAFIDSLRKHHLWYSRDWKEHVWYCRKGRLEGPPPAKLDKLWKAGQAQLIGGHICRCAPAVIPRIKKEEVQERITEGDVLSIEGRNATQSVFTDAEVVDRLGVIVRGKVHIEIHPALGYKV